MTPIADKDKLRVLVDKWCTGTFTETDLETYGPINAWDLSLITDMSFLFFNKRTFNEDISWWDVSKVENMEYMFCGAEMFNQCLEKWNLRNVKKMNGMFAPAFNQPLDVKQVTSGAQLYAKTFNQSLEKTWDDVITILKRENEELKKQIELLKKENKELETYLGFKNITLEEC